LIGFFAFGKDRGKGKRKKEKGKREIIVVEAHGCATHDGCAMKVKGKR